MEDAHSGEAGDERQLPPMVEPSTREEDAIAARLVERFKAGDMEAFGELYSLYFERVFRYLKVLLRNTDDAEDVAQQSFTQALEALHSYEPRRPFWVWLWVIVRNQALNELRRRSRLEVEDPETINRRRDRAVDEEGFKIPVWITDSDLVIFIERLPLAQRQALLMRFMLDVDNRRIGEVLGRTPSNVSLLIHRALKFLRARLIAVGREPESPEGPVESQRGHRKSNVLRARRFALDP